MMSSFLLICTAASVTAADVEPAMVPDAAMYRKDWSPKPHARAWEELVHKAWWTDISTVTGSDGTCRVRGFKGEYHISSGTAQTHATMLDGTVNVIIQLP